MQLAVAPDFADSPRLPVIDLSLTGSGRPWLDHLGAQLDWAASEYGFFYVVGHGVARDSVAEMHAAARGFFALPESRKRPLHMSRGGRAWRGWFPVGGELTSGQPDLKEGLYLGADLDERDVRVREHVPLHGPNLYPDLPGFRDATLRYLDELSALSQRLLESFAHGLGLPDGWFREHYTRDPTLLFRLFNYPAAASGDRGGFGVGEHTDYGLITVLWQDEAGGLQVKHGDDWLDVPYLPDSFVVNVGDMLERLTGGRYVSALHRVVNSSGRDRISMPFFFDPQFDARLVPIPGVRPAGAARPATRRWDGLDLQSLSGTYGEYLVSKVARVFPELGRRQLGGGALDISV